MRDPFIILHTSAGEFWYRADAIVSIDRPLPNEGADWARCVINTQGVQRFVRETPAEVHALILGQDSPP